jgi:hypothetical protein
MILKMCFRVPRGGYSEGVCRLKITVLVPRNRFFENIKKSHRSQPKTWYMDMIFSKSKAGNISETGDSRTDLMEHIYKTFFSRETIHDPQGPSLASQTDKKIKF